jgi:hypothetical protein
MLCDGKSSARPNKIELVAHPAQRSAQGGNRPRMATSGSAALRRERTSTSCNQSGASGEGPNGLSLLFSFTRMAVMLRRVSLGSGRVSCAHFKAFHRDGAEPIEPPLPILCGSIPRLYLDPQAAELREALVARHGVKPEPVFVGRGSDEVRETDPTPGAVRRALRARCGPSLAYKGDFCQHRYIPLKITLARL